MTFDDSPSDVTEFSDEQRKLLAYLLEEEGVEFAAAETIKPRPAGEKIPLTFAQQRLWFLWRLEPEEALYNISLPLELRGPLGVAQLEQAINEIVARHEILRTVFVETEPEASQVVLPFVSRPLPIVDLTAFADYEARARELAAADAAQPVDLQHGPLLRCTLLKAAADHHFLLLTMHHIVSDGWSLGVFMRELAALYTSFSTNQPAPLSPLSIQYADYAYWQRETLTGATLDAELDFWKKQLAGAPPVIELPTDRPRPAVQTYNGAKIEFALSEELSEAVSTLTRRQGSTLFITLLASFAALLQRYTGQDDVVVGFPIANRTSAETENLIGLFANTLLLRARFEHRLSFMSLLEQVRETALEAETHQALPIEKLVEALRPQRDMSHAPLFQVMFTFQGERLPLELHNLTVSPLHVHGRTANFDLSLTMMESRGGLIGSLEYNSDLFEATTVARMLETFKRLLAEVTAHPDGDVATIPLLAEPERRQMLAAPDVAAGHAGEFVAVQHMFEAQAKREPLAVALVCGEASLTYGELNARANRLANYLRARGVGGETRVGLCVEKSPEMIVGLLGILKAGAAYVPLDPQYPSERLAFMLEDAQVWGVLIQRHLADRLPAAERVARILLDAEGEDFAAHSDENPRVELSGENLCYVIYTSGSTGRPKGVMISHAALGSFTVAAAREYEIVSADRVLQFASINFDASAEEIYPCLTRGATLVLRTDEMMGAIPTFLRHCRERAITVLDLPTAYWHELALTFEREPVTFPPAVRLVIIGGEKARAAQLQSWRTYAPPHVRLINTYGPTEATVVATRHDLSQQRAEDATLQAASIGRAMPHAQALVLDRQLQLSLVGVPGELHIGGSGLARGYLGQPAMTADKFIPHPFAATPGERLYKTGDMVRYLPNGRLEFLRRLDRQVKVRGFRIELEEINAALAGHPGVQDAVVVLRAEEGGDGQLVAYVVFAAESAPTSAELREYLRERLPDYMLPSFFLPLPALPLSPSGKLDPRALPLPDSSLLASTQHTRAPFDADHQLLAALWSELLGLPHVGLDDDFFELGGHSLLATRLISRLRQLFGVELPLRTLFEHSTLAAFTEQVRRAQRGATAADTTPPITPRHARRAPLSYGQQRLWFIQQLDEESSAYNIANAVRLRGQLDVAALERALREIVRRHAVLRTVIEVEAGEPVQVIEEGGEQRWQLQVEELSVAGEEAGVGSEEGSARQREDDIRAVVGQEARRPFRLAREWPLRVKLWRVGADDHVLVVALHHAAADGWSVGVLSQELSVLYGAYAGGSEASPLRELEVQYADYAMWQRERLAGEEMERQVGYWRERLAGASGVLEVRGDRERGAVASERGGEAKLEVSEEVTEGLKAVGAREGATMFMVMLSAFYTLLYHFSNQRDINIGINTAGRNRSELEGLIGFFINMLALRVDVSGNPRFSETLVQVRKTLLDAYAYQDVPFDKLVEELKPPRLPGVTPFFQVVFNFNNRVVQSAPAGMPGLVTSAIPVGQAAVKFDLVFDMQERERGLTGTMTYNAALFDAATIEQLMRNFEVLLKHVAAHPDTHLDDLKTLLAQADKQDENLKRREFRETRRKMFKHIAARAGLRAGAKGDEE